MTIRTQPIGSGPTFMALMDRVSDYASTNRPVLIAGERGTGKELIASRVHFLSPRWEKENVHVNCAAFTEIELDRELFGQTFMDGRVDTNGRFFEADSGTLFLDAIEMMPLRLQEKLMHTLEHGKVQATGELYNEEVDVRVVAATAVDLPSAVARGDFRADLLDRLAFHVLTLPPLRARTDDIAALVDHFGRSVARELGAEQFPGFTAEAQEEIRAHRFPGNVRELKNVVARSTVQAFLEDENLTEPIDVINFDPFESPYRLRDARPPIAPPTPTPVTPQAIDPEHVSPITPQPGPTPAAPDNFTDRVMTFERRLIDEALRASHDHQGKAAERLALSYHQFRGLLRKHGLKK
ncbi:sigma-54-dependent Fis family transcriptional regulator [Algimonas arctica]|uniref:Sigma-54-dependent Fis family transcriptional regulator n=1 Tax=Algimonas arctica TaxID=1479486 RepID=A0A8J3G1T8_9PROT|nr:sigma 54-interacting transcriptional regulator [Algimonas arctica]GHA89065.1 sigma-54-dependent Fis family transcriptional regulator [Algimonas arctica]